MGHWSGHSLDWRVLISSSRSSLIIGKTSFMDFHDVGRFIASAHS
jgi:hypothetical protein